METQQLEEIIECLSEVRLKKYCPIINEESLAKYSQQLELNSKLYIPLNIFEIILRNKIHNAVSLIFNDSNWLINIEKDPNSNASNLLSKVKYFTLTKTKKLISDAYLASRKTAKKQEREVIEGDLISNLSFGFWTSILSKSFSNILHNKGLFLKIFPNFSFNKLGTSEYLDEEKYFREILDKIRQERNRVFHHEIVKEPITTEENLWDIINYMSKASHNYFHKKNNDN